MVKGTVGVEDDAVPLGQGNKNLGKYQSEVTAWEVGKEGKQGRGGEEVPEKKKICMLESKFFFLR